MSRYLADGLGWYLSAGPVDKRSEAVYLSAYFEIQKLNSANKLPVGAYFTHKEEDPPGNQKARLFDSIGRKVELRIVTAPMYAYALSPYGPTVCVPAPVERDHFVISDRKGGPRRKLAVGLSGYTYPNKRKGDDLVKVAVETYPRVDWRASGRGWPVKTVRYRWGDLPAFYQSLDVLLVPSRVEGIPMPPLEALAGGIPVVIPRGVGMLDDLPDIPGIYRYAKGEAGDMLAALGRAIEECRSVNRETLREAVAPYSVEAFVGAVGGAFAEQFGSVVEERPALLSYTQRAKKSVRGIYCVAFGEPSRKCAERLIVSIKEYMPDVPVALCGAEPLGPEDIFIEQQDTDVGGRRAKLAVYDLAPQEWESILYLDADTMLVASVYQFFEWLEDGWEFVITKDPHLMDTMESYRRRNNADEVALVRGVAKTLNLLQLNGGVWAFRRCRRMKTLFARWQRHWERYAQRDQGALFQALYESPPKMLVLGNEFNCFEKYSRDTKAPLLMHYPQEARRWRGQIPGRIDSEEAWEMVGQFEKRAGRG